MNVQSHSNHTQSHSNNTQSHSNHTQNHSDRVDGYNPRTEGYDPKKFKLPSDDITFKPHVGRHQDEVHLSSEAEEMAAVDPGVCKNDWRCLQALDLRGLLA